MVRWPIVDQAMDMRAVTALLFATATACGGGLGELADPSGPAELSAAAPAAPADALVAIHAGEQMRFEVRVAGVLAGEATFATVALEEDGAARTATLSSSIRSAGALALIKDVRDEATTVLDVGALVPVSTRSAVRANPRDYAAETRFRGAQVEIDFRPNDGPPQHLVYDFGAAVAHDAHSAMATMRVWQAAAGTQRTLWVLGGRRIWKVELTMGRAEVIGTYGGNQAALRIDGVASRAFANLTVDAKRPPRTFSVWMSDDADRVPFRIVAGTELGDVTIDLVDYQRP